MKMFVGMMFRDGNELYSWNGTFSPSFDPPRVKLIRHFPRPRRLGLPMPWNQFWVSAEWVRMMTNLEFNQ